MEYKATERWIMHLAEQLVIRNKYIKYNQGIYVNFIFEHGKEIVKSPHGITIQALSTALGLGSLWPPNGEGFVYFERCQMVFSLVKPFLEAGDKGGFLKLCTEVKSIK